MSAADDRQATVAQLQQMIRSFVADRDWQQFHTPRSLGMAIAVEAAELLDEMKWMTDSELAAQVPADLKQAMQDELSDVVILCLSFFNAIDVDAAEAIQSKIARNGDKYPVDRFHGRWR